MDRVSGHIGRRTRIAGNREMHGKHEVLRRIWRMEDLAEATAKALALAALTTPIVGVISNDTAPPSRDGWAVAA